MSGDYRNLIAWQKAKRLALDVYRCTRRFPKDETYGLSLTDAARSRVGSK